MGRERPLALIAEEEPVTRDLMALALERLGCQVLFANNGEEVLEVFELTPPGLVIMDTFLSRLNGLDVLRRLRKSGRLRQSRVILISAFGFEEIVQQAVEAGATDFFVKPLDLDRFISRAQKILGEIQSDLKLE